MNAAHKKRRGGRKGEREWMGPTFGASYIGYRPALSNVFELGREECLQLSCEIPRHVKVLYVAHANQPSDAMGGVSTRARGSGHFAYIKHWIIRTLWSSVVDVFPLLGYMY